MKKRIKFTVLLAVAIHVASLFLSFNVVMADAGMDYSIARGGRLYDKWFNENNMDKPLEANPVYPETGNYRGNKASDWRCKECHGWDYKGAQGAYSSGKHYTGTKGTISGMKIDTKIMRKILRNKHHPYTDTMLSDKDISDLINFLQEGQFDMSAYIDSKTKLAKGNAQNGEKYYQTVCASCHALDGKGEKTPPLGALSIKNPWEVLHKMLNGQPGEEMPALRAFDISIAIDILAYMQGQLPRN